MSLAITLFFAVLFGTSIGSAATYYALTTTASLSGAIAFNFLGTFLGTLVGVLIGYPIVRRVVEQRAPRT